MTIKGAASLLIIWGILVQHTSFALSRRAPFTRSAKPTQSQSQSQSEHHSKEYTNQSISKGNSRNESIIGTSKSTKRGGLYTGIYDGEGSSDYESDRQPPPRKPQSSSSSSSYEYFDNDNDNDNDIDNDIDNDYENDYSCENNERKEKATSRSTSTRSTSSTSSTTPTSNDSTTSTRASTLIQIPVSLKLQHASDTHDAVPISAFLDTGAQVTVMTYNAAKRAGIAHLIDTRYSGHACGVAGVSCRVLGRIPANSVSFILDKDSVVDVSPAITVLEDRIMEGDTVDMLLGLDVLEDWQAMVCLRDRTLTVRNGCRRSKNRGFVIPFVGNVKPTESKPSRDKEYKSTASISSSKHRDSRYSMPNSHEQYTYSGSSRHQNKPSQDQGYPSGKRESPLARDSFLLEEELDALDERSSRIHKGAAQMRTNTYGNGDIDPFEDEVDDDYDDSNYFESDDDYDGCDLSGH